MISANLSLSLSVGRGEERGGVSGPGGEGEGRQPATGNPLRQKAISAALSVL